MRIATVAATKASEKKRQAKQQPAHYIALAMAIMFAAGVLCTLIPGSAPRPLAQPDIGKRMQIPSGVLPPIGSKIDHAVTPRQPVHTMTQSSEHPAPHEANAAIFRFTPRAARSNRIMT